MPYIVYVYVVCVVMFVDCRQSFIENLFKKHDFAMFFFKCFFY